jgi:amidase
VPIGETQGLPLGVTFMSRPYTEAELLAWGHAFEQATRARKAPHYKPTLSER